MGPKIDGAVRPKIDGAVGAKIDGAVGPKIDSTREVNEMEAMAMDIQTARCATVRSYSNVHVTCMSYR